MKTLVVTGGIGSGKSLVCSYLSSKGIPVYHSDARAKALYDENPLIVLDLEQALGTSLRDEEGRFDRRRMGEIIFNDPEKLRQVEEIIHPLIFEDFLGWRNDRFGEFPFVVMESAIFLEKPIFHPLADVILLIEAPAEVRLRRACERDGSPEEMIRKRMDAQHFDAAKVDAVIENDADIETLFRRVDEAMSILNSKLI